jgi:GNAT superfamily N-acetyltransferase
MQAEIVIRRVNPGENDLVQAMVQAIADETFAYLFPSSPVPFGQPNWSAAWLAIAGEETVGVTMTGDEWVNDLWVRGEYRKTGVGGKLLAHAEGEIRDRGHQILRLRVVKSNTRALHFYQNRGWAVYREFPHEKFGHVMYELNKPNETLPER